MFERFFKDSAESTPQNRFTKFEKRLSFDDSFSPLPLKPETKRKKGQREAGLLHFLLLCAFFSVLATLFCQLPRSVAVKCLKSMGIGVVAVYLSWEMVYFDSYTPGITPPSPLSPRKNSPDNWIHTCYMFSILNGVLFSILALFWL